MKKKIYIYIYIYHTIRPVPKYNRKIIENLANWKLLTHRYMIADFLGLAWYRHCSTKVTGLS